MVLQPDRVQVAEVSAPVVSAPVVSALVVLGCLQIGKLPRMSKWLQGLEWFQFHYICKHFR
jgi:hypothetical protein